MNYEVQYLQITSFNSPTCFSYIFGGDFRRILWELALQTERRHSIWRCKGWALEFIIWSTTKHLLGFKTSHKSLNTFRLLTIKKAWKKTRWRFLHQFFTSFVGGDVQLATSMTRCTSGCNQRSALFCSWEVLLKPSQPSEVRGMTWIPCVNCNWHLLSERLPNPAWLRVKLGAEYQNNEALN